MLALSQGYKQGRAVIFYDLVDETGACIKKMASKDEVVELCSNGEVSNAKIQWWEGKPIVRCANKALPLLRIDENKNIIGTAVQATRGSSENNVKHNEPEKTIDISDKSVVVGKVSTHKKKETTFPGYSRETALEKHELNKSVQFPSGSTVSDMFDIMAQDFGIRNTDEYKKSFASKVNLDKQLDSMNQSMLAGIQNALAVYLMNMANLEIRNTYLKYYV